MAEKAVDVFISYKAEEFDEATFIKQVLETNGIRCWLAPNSIPGGSSYASEIPKAIRGCKVFVVLISKIAQESKWVPRELDQAVNANKIIMPFMLENCELKDDFNFYLSNVQRYAAYENKAKSLEKMVNEIKAILNADKPAPAPQSAQPVPVPQPAQPVPASQPAQPAPAPQPAQPAPAPQPAQPAPAGQKKAKKSGKAGKKNSKKVLVIIAAAVAALAVVIVCVSVLSKVTIAGERIKKSDMSVTLEDKALSQEDVQKLLALKDMRTLHLTNCQLEPREIKAILESDKLSGLTLDNCGVRDEDLNAASLENSTLTQLDLSNNAVSDITALKPLSDSLYSLALGNNKVGNIEALQGFEKLQNLDINNNELESLSGLEQAIKLESINACANHIGDLDGLKNATVLYSVKLNENNIGNIDVLAKSAATLKTVLLANNQLSDINALADCVALQTVDLDHNTIGSLNALSGCEELSILSAAGNRLTDTQGLKSKALTFLDLSDNFIADISDLAALELKEHIQLRLHQNAIKHLDLPAAKFTYLSIFDNPMENGDVYVVDSSQLVMDYFDGLDFSTVNSEHTTTYYIIGCPLDRQVSLKENAQSCVVEFIDKEQALKEIPDRPYALQ